MTWLVWVVAEYPYSAVLGPDHKFTSGNAVTSLRLVKDNQPYRRYRAKLFGYRFIRNTQSSVIIHDCSPRTT